MSEHGCMLTVLMKNCDLQMPEDGNLDDTVREEDAADVAARKRAAAKAQEEAELRQRSQVRCSPLLHMLARPFVAAL